MQALRRDLAAMADAHHDVLIIGGGITGACIAREAACAGLRVALVEQGDFSGATSSATSKLVHGGLRYLRNFEVRLVRESLAERRIWCESAPHLVFPLPFLLPVDGGRLMLAAGLTLYDWLSFDRNRVAAPDRRMAAHHWLAAGEACAAEPVLEGAAMSGAYRYFDARMEFPERLGLECLIDAAGNGAMIANHAEAVAIIEDGRAVGGARIHDRLNGRDHTVHARITVNAAGPWADRVLELAGLAGARRITRSRGAHVIVRRLNAGHALTLATPDGHLFLLPWRGHTIIGTTDTAFAGPPETVAPTAADVDHLIGAANAALPAARLTRADVLAAYAGLRPLVGGGGGETYDASRAAEIVDHGAEHGRPGLVSALGGKWTTSRALGERTLGVIARALDRRLPATRTASRPLPGGAIGSASQYFADAPAHADHVRPEAALHLARTYGALMDGPARLAAEQPALRDPLDPRTGVLAAEIVHAARTEMAMTLADAVFRRTGLGALGHPGRAAIDCAAALMAAERGWADAQTADEVARVEAHFAQARP